MAEIDALILQDRGFLEIDGTEAKSFLQGLISNDTREIGPEKSIYAALLTPQGKFLFDFLLHERANGLLLETRLGDLVDLQRRLLLYRLRTPVEINLAADPPAVMALYGQDCLQAFDMPSSPGAARLEDGLRLVVDPRRAEMGLRAMGSLATLQDLAARMGVRTVEALDYERHRIGLGVPESGIDLIPNQSILLESNFEELHGVAFDKGCYVGQELTARTKYRGLVKKRLVPVAIEGDAPAAHTLIMADGREAGQIRSIAGNRGLALLRLDYLSGEPMLRAGEARIIPLTPVWAA